jgi:hypothetical protein
MKRQQIGSVRAAIMRVPGGRIIYMDVFSRLDSDIPVRGSSFSHLGFNGENGASR